MLLPKPMVAWRIPRWVLPAALGGVLAIAGADAVLMRPHPVSVRPRTIPEAIGLRADAEGAGLRVQWDRASRPIRNADHAVLFIEDGALRSQLDLTGRQLDSSSVMYWPASEPVAFRLVVYRGGQSSSDSTAFAPAPGGNRSRQAGPARAIVQASRPSPFDLMEPEVVVTQTRPAPVMVHKAPAAALAAAPAVAAAVVEPPAEGGFGRFLSKIPLLRRLRKHPPADGTEPR